MKNHLCCEVRTNPLADATIEDHVRALRERLLWLSVNASLGQLMSMTNVMQTNEAPTPLEKERDEVRSVRTKHRRLRGWVSLFRPDTQPQPEGLAA